MKPATPHKFILGEAVEYTPPLGLYTPPGLYVVTAKLPERDGEFDYRIKRIGELFKRTARVDQVHETLR
jgi:hypothetical protein